jgi:hypothetical protein
MRVVTAISDLHLIAAAPLVGGKLEHIDREPSGRLVFHFLGLPENFLELAFNGDFTVNLAAYVSSLERVHAIVAQYKVRR